jgi:hypothetical protein
MRFAGLCVVPQDSPFGEGVLAGFGWEIVNVINGWGHGAEGREQRSWRPDDGGMGGSRGLLARTSPLVGKRQPAHLGTWNADRRSPRGRGWVPIRQRARASRLDTRGACGTPLEKGAILTLVSSVCWQGMGNGSNRGRMRVRAPPFCRPLHLIGYYRREWGKVNVRANFCAPPVSGFWGQLRAWCLRSRRA